MDHKMVERLDVILTILSRSRSDSSSVMKFFERCKGQPDCLVRIVELDSEHNIDVEDPDDRNNLLSALRSGIHSSVDHRMNDLSKLPYLMAYAAILENDREAMDLIVRLASDQSSPILCSFISSIDNYTYQHIMEADFSVARRLFEMALEVETLSQSAGTSRSFFCNALWVMQKDNTGLPVDREMNGRFLEKCLPYGPIYPAIYFNAACLYVEMNEYDKALGCIGLAKKYNYNGYDNMLEQIRTVPMFEDFRKDERVMKIIGK